MPDQLICTKQQSTLRHRQLVYCRQIRILNESGVSSYITRQYLVRFNCFLFWVLKLVIDDWNYKSYKFLSPYIFLQACKCHVVALPLTTTPHPYSSRVPFGKIKWLLCYKGESLYNLAGLVYVAVLITSTWQEYFKRGINILTFTTVDS